MARKRGFKKKGRCVSCKRDIYAKCGNCGSQRLKRLVDWDIKEEWFYCKKCKLNNHWVTCDNCFSQNPILRFDRKILLSLILLPMKIVYYLIIRPFLSMRKNNAVDREVNKIKDQEDQEIQNQNQDKEHNNKNSISWKRIITTVAIFFIAYGFIVNNRNQNKHTKNQTPKTTSFTENNRLKLVKDCLDYDVAQFKKFVNDSRERISTDKLLKNEIKNRILKEKENYYRKNKQLRKELSALKKLNIPDKEKKKKAFSINKNGRFNQAQINNLKEKISYFSKVFAIKNK